MITHNLFPTLVVEHDFSNYPNVDNLISLIRNTPTTDHGALEKGSSSFKDANCFLTKYKLYDLKNNIKKVLDLYCHDYGIHPVEIKASWFNILNKGGKTLRHKHHNSAISGAYYPLLEENTCNLIFHSPLIPYQTTPIFRETQYNCGGISVPLKPGHLYMWPSWLEHESEINKGGERIVLSFNGNYTFPNP